MRIVFLCTGNTCRSPLAAALAARRWADVASFRSAGLQAAPGLPATEGAQIAAAEMAADLGAHRSQPVSADLLREADWVIGMTRSHAAIFRARYGDGFAGKIGVLGAPGVDLTRHEAGGAAEEIPDPFGGEVESYRAVARQIARLLDVWEPEFRAKGRP